MALSFYEEPNVDSIITDNNPLRFTFDGRIGGIIDKKYYIHNEDLNRYYTDIQITAVDLGGAGRVTEAITGYYVKLAEKDTSLSSEEWALITKGNTLSLSIDLGNSVSGDIVTYLPIWVRISIPVGIAIQTIENIVVRISATENLV